VSRLARKGRLTVPRPLPSETMLVLIHLKAKINELDEGT